VYWRVGIGLAEAKWYVLAALLVAITETDLRAKLIPDKITYPGTAVGLAFGLFSGGRPFAMAIAGAVVGFVALEAFRRLMSRLATMEVMGMGDSKLLMMCGAYLGPQLVIVSLLPGTVIGLVFGIVYTRVFKSPHFPFGPALGLGALVTAIFSEEILAGVAALPQLMLEMGPAARIGLMVGCFVVLVFLMRRIRKRAADYTRQIEEDYASREDDE
jgi:prepilin signal peptidase PulO-like enzyme (type II secretory pathway)